MIETIPSGEEQLEIIQQVAVTANEKLDAGSQGNATQALNLGCTVTFLPGMILVVLVWLFSRFNWIMAAITLVLVAMISMIFANLVATLSRSRSIERMYRTEVESEINQALLEANISREFFDDEIKKILPANAPLLQAVSQTKQVPRRKDS